MGLGHCLHRARKLDSVQITKLFALFRIIFLKKIHNENT